MASPVTATTPAVAAPPPTAISGAAAMAACAAMAVSYVAILYAPTLVLRLPPPDSFRAFLLRRFACAAVSSAASALAAASLLGVWRLGELPSMLRVFGIRSDHFWEAVAIPLLLTSLVYAGSFAAILWPLTCSWSGNGAGRLCDGIVASCGQKLVDLIRAKAHDILAWRNYVVGISCPPLWLMSFVT